MAQPYVASTPDLIEQMSYEFERPTLQKVRDNTTFSLTLSDAWVWRLSDALGHTAVSSKVLLLYNSPDYMRDEIE
jgi:hypothetical protein